MGCPRNHLHRRNTVLVQGRALPKDDKAQLTVPGHEDVVEIPGNFSQIGRSPQKLRLPESSETEG